MHRKYAAKAVYGSRGEQGRYILSTQLK